MLEVCGGAVISERGSASMRKEFYLNRVVKRYFPSASPIEGYWDNIARVSSQQRIRKLQKEKKLSKFFGAVKSDEKTSLLPELQRQISSMLSFHKDVKPSAAQKFCTDDSMSILDCDTQSTIGEYVEEDVYSRKKRSDKLTDFFGNKVNVNNTPEANSARSSMQSDVTTVSPDGENVLATKMATLNELSSETKAMLTKRSKKLRSVLGETLDENMAYDRYAI
jgi:hypothetical protein